MSSTQRPMVLVALVILIAVLGALATGLGLYLIVLDLPITPGGPMGHLAALLGLFVLVPGAIELVLAYGLWKLKPWAWWLGVIMHAFVAALVAIAIFSRDITIPLLITVGLLAIVACLFTPTSEARF